MTKFSLVKKILLWYDFSMCDVGNSFQVKENGTSNVQEFSSLEEILKAFYSILKATNENLKMCHYQIWSDDEIAFISALAEMITNLVMSLAEWVVGLLTGGSPISLLVVITLIVLILGKLRGNDRY